MKTSSPPRPPTVRSVAELVALVPTLLGFHPDTSLVLIAMTAPIDIGSRQGRPVARGELVGTLRIDLPGHGPEPAFDAEVLRLGALLRYRGAGVVFLVAYPGDAGDGLPDRLCDWADLLDAQGLVVEGAYVVRGGYLIAADVPQGEPIPLPGSTATAAGQSLNEKLGKPACDRERLLDGLAPQRQPLACQALTASLQNPDRLEPTFEQQLLGWHAVLRPDAPHPGLTQREADRFVRKVPVEQLADALILLEDIHRRDALIGWLFPVGFPPELMSPELPGRVEAVLGESPDPADAGWWVEPICALAGVSPIFMLAPVYTLVAVAGWSAGRPVVAIEAARRALDLDPGQSLAGIVERCLECGIKPG